ncbi:hypothetical protein GUJ93_ZPchr0003g18578 [Zizania palustris]|uniref:Uncharacterized protein n=1 Tax=Zizania palustris TaxID=103762 RepID=A0A8J5RZ78_ZIZPA|nr:hypothetical protein GUJ93_ZPchr0003g18578 [Zizania palustris]KAG8063477.1 hypothetical protein GUJ93_ZPchr0003g18578 [Zizania palustris]
MATSTAADFFKLLKENTSSDLRCAENNQKTEDTKQNPQIAPNGNNRGPGKRQDTHHEKSPGSGQANAELSQARPLAARVAGGRIRGSEGAAAAAAASASVAVAALSGAPDRRRIPRRRD